MVPNSIVSSAHLDLAPWTVELIDGFEIGDRMTSQAAMGVFFPDPFAPPPETGDVLDYFRTTVASDTSHGAFVPRLIRRREDRMAVGSIGLIPPDDVGATLIGYSVYPSLTGQGYASEAAALVEWALRRPEIKAIRATIPVGHIASELIAGRAGLMLTGEQVEDENEGTLNIWERTSETLTPGLSPAAAREGS